MHGFDLRWPCEDCLHFVDTVFCEWITRSSRVVSEILRNISCCVIKYIGNLYYRTKWIFFIARIRYKKNYFLIKISHCIWYLSLELLIHCTQFHVLLVLCGNRKHWKYVFNFEELPSSFNGSCSWSQASTTYWWL